LEFIESIGNLIEKGMVTPERLNEGLANYFSVNRYLTEIYESVQEDYEKEKISYDIWWSELFLIERHDLNDGQPKSKFASQAEINSAVIVNHKEDYKKHQETLLMKERRCSFYRRLLDSWKTQSQMLINLSQNMRSEMNALYVENKANKDMTKENLIRHNNEGLKENIKVKKIRQD
jgi:hypothetical protein